jgi:hypothetical protein
LNRLFKASGLLVSEALLREKGMPEREAKTYVREMEAARNQICRLWANEYRFTSEARLRAHLKRMQLDRGIQGDFLKKNAGDLLSSAQSFLNKGVFQWQLLKKSGPT